MTAGMFHVTNLTPGSDNENTSNCDKTSPGVNSPTFLALTRATAAASDPRDSPWSSRMASSAPL
jgi:hypothetical protein